MTTVSINDHVVRSALKRVTTVATLPASAMRIMKIAENPMSTEDELLQVVETEGLADAEKQLMGVRP